jgi:hypothetical protein
VEQIESKLGLPESLMNLGQNSRRVAAMVLVTLAFLRVANAAPTTPKRVLLVYQSEVYSPASLELQQGILDHLRIVRSGYRVLL